MTLPLDWTIKSYLILFCRCNRMKKQQSYICMDSKITMDKL